MNDSPNSNGQSWLAIILLLLGGVFLIVKSNMDALANFAPVMAFAFTGAIVMPKRFRIAIPLLLVLMTDLFIYGAEAFSHSFVLVKYGLFLAAALWGASLAQRISITGTLGRVLGCSLVFYLVANTAAWFGSASYAPTFAGWLQANTTGVPGFPPSWLFLRNSLLSDFGFTLVLLVAFNWESAKKRLPTLPWAPVAQRA